MDIGVISVRYARALLKSALERKEEEQVYLDMQTLSKSYIEVNQLRHVINNPMLTREQKQQLLETEPIYPNALLNSCCKRVVKISSSLWLHRTSPSIVNKRISYVENLPPPQPYRLKPRQRCGKWWKVKLWEQWSFRQK